MVGPVTLRTHTRLDLTQQYDDIATGLCVTWYIIPSLMFEGCSHITGCVTTCPAVGLLQYKTPHRRRRHSLRSLSYRHQAHLSHWISPSPPLVKGIRTRRMRMRMMLWGRD